MNTIEKFTAVEKLLMSTPIWQAMEDTVENSPYHREANVAAHTNMVVQEFIDHHAHKHTPKDQAIGLLALLFHDTGKPGAKEEVYSEARGNYVRFAGHEQVSARVWEDFAAKNWDFLMETFGLTPHDFYTITWMIENHLPYSLAKPEKVRAFLDTVVSIFDNTDLFYDCLLCDTYGRISDDAEAKRKSTHEWIQKMKEMEPESVEHKDLHSFSPKMAILIGASGSGKSTWSANNTEYTTYSWDDLRIKFAQENGVKSDDPIEQYRAAFDLCNENKNAFDNYQRGKFMWLITRGIDVAIDNINVSRKSRATFITEAKKKGYKITAHLFPISRDTLIKRHGTRTDKRIPLDAVLSHYARLSMPNLGSEVHNVVVNLTNL